jgi:hypothetical protein
VLPRQIDQIHRHVVAASGPIGSSKRAQGLGPGSAIFEPMARAGTAWRKPMIFDCHADYRWRVEPALLAPEWVPDAPACRSRRQFSTTYRRFQWANKRRVVPAEPTCPANLLILHKLKLAERVGFEPDRTL